MQKVRVEISFKRWFGELPTTTKLKKDIVRVFSVITDSIGENAGYCILLSKGIVKRNSTEYY